MKHHRIVALLVVLASPLLIASACEQSDLEVAREVQSDVMSVAINAEPPYQPSNFPARRDINRYLQETEQPGEWYTYALTRDGQPIFYVVSDSKPRNLCVSITAPDRAIGPSSSRVVLSAPALDGVYYGGAACDAYYLWDASTSNFIEIAGSSYTLLSTRVPLRLETDPMLLGWDTSQQ